MSSIDDFGAAGIMFGCGGRCRAFSKTFCGVCVVSVGGGVNGIIDAPSCAALWSGGWVATGGANGTIGIVDCGSGSLAGVGYGAGLRLLRGSLSGNGAVVQPSARRFSTALPVDVPSFFARAA